MGVGILEDTQHAWSIPESYRTAVLLLYHSQHVSLPTTPSRLLQLSTFNMVLKRCCRCLLAQL